MSRPAPGPHHLTVWLGDVRVGTLVRSPPGSDTSRFRFLPSYLARVRRPVLGQAFLDEPERVWTTTLRLPPFFSNLLPDRDSPLRRAIARELGCSSEREFLLIASLGEDLPGNVIVRPSEETEEPELAPAATESAAPPEDASAAAAAAPLEPDAPVPPAPLRFSLGGMQPKFSMQRRGRGLTLPAQGRGGDWIVKLPSAETPRLPENEWSMMTWARRSGIQVPACELVDVAALQGIPPGFLHTGERLCYAVQRFDRPAPGRRLHMEDFAQVLGLYDGDEKYDAYNYETLGRLIDHLCGEDDLREFVRRLVFLALSGNADAHHKNWSLTYPNGIEACLSPAYDLVSTVVYPEYDAKLALPFARSRSFSAFSLEGFRRFARKLGRDPAEMADWVRTDVTQMLDTWASLRGELPLTAEAVARIERHQQTLPLRTART